MRSVSLCFEYQFSFILKLEGIIITKIPHLDSKEKAEENSEKAHSPKTATVRNNNDIIFFSCFQVTIYWIFLINLSFYLSLS